MIKKIKSILSNSKQSLFTLNSQPFTKFSILLIVFLDIFLLITILNGISSEKKMAPTVNTRYPVSCKNHFNPIYKHRNWDNTTNRYLFIEDSFPFKEYDSFKRLNNYGYYSKNNIQVKDNLIVSDICRELDEKLAVFMSTREFKNNKKLLTKLKNDKRNIFSDINNIERRYNTNLFERTADIKGSDISKTKNKYYLLISKEKNIDNQIINIKKVSSYKGYKEYVDFINKNIDSFKKEFDRYKFWQPFVSFLYLLKFAFPLLLLSMLTYRITNRINKTESTPRKLLKLISGHIVLISSIPIFANTMYLIYHIIPHRFFESIVAFLYKFGFIFLGYYLLIFIGILFFGLLIFFIQRSVSRREKLRQELKEKTLYIDAYNKNKCPNCKNKVDYKRSYCGYCKEDLNRECTSCKKKTPKNIKYCLDCGEE